MSLAGSRRLHKESPLQGDKVPVFRCLCMGGDGRVSHLARCTTARRRRPNRHRRPDAGATRSTAIARQAQGIRGGEATERWSSDPGHLKRGALGGDGDDARPGGSGPAEVKRLRRRVASGRRCGRERLLERSGQTPAVEGRAGERGR
jgi:hypothetical protein